MTRISIMGDSLSTYEGYNPAGFAVHYEKEMLQYNGFTSVEETWWMKVIRHLDGELCVCDVYSGSRVSGEGFPAANSKERVEALSKEGLIPDCILVYIGFNDFGYGVPTESGHLFRKDVGFFMMPISQCLRGSGRNFPKQRYTAVH